LPKDWSVSGYLVRNENRFLQINSSLITFMLLLIAINNLIIFKLLEIKS
jgi:hypothetical protein